MAKKKYVLVGTGGRSAMYLHALAGTYADRARLLAVCDVNQTRMDFHRQELADKFGLGDVATYKAHEFDRMLAEQQPDAVVVTSIDRTHHRYICAALDHGCDVVTEKPMTVDAAKCQQVVDAVQRSGRRLTVTFNYRYSPRNAKVKEILQSGAIGDVFSVHFEWLLDTRHGADYFRRWHRDKRNSGGLFVHKASHHFDLVNWWLGSSPELVFALGQLRFYGRENAEERGVTEFYSRARGSEAAANDPFALRANPEKDHYLNGLYFHAEHEDGYFRDQSVFGDGISIEDTMNVLVRYRNRAQMSYTLTAYSPWEGYRVMFNGSQGRLEFNVVETPYVSGSHTDFNLPGAHEFQGDTKTLVPEILVHPHWGKPQQVDYEVSKGGHGGGDVRLLEDVFGDPQPDPLGRAADFRDGVHSILTGIAANQALRTGLPVTVADLVTLP